MRSANPKGRRSVTPSGSSSKSSRATSISAAPMTTRLPNSSIGASARVVVAITSQFASAKRSTTSAKASARSSVRSGRSVTTISAACSSASSTASASTPASKSRKKQGDEPRSQNTCSNWNITDAYSNASVAFPNPGGATTRRRAPRSSRSRDRRRGRLLRRSGTTPWGRLPSQALCWMKRVMGISFFFRPSLTTGRTLRGPDCPGNQQGTQGRRSPSIAARTNRPQHTGSLAKGTRKHKEHARKARGRRLQSSAEKLQRHSRSMQATSSRTAPARRALAVLSRHRQKAASARCRPRRDGADKKQGRRHGFSTVRARALPRNRGGSARASGKSISAKPRRSARA